jgi:peroxiredoxin Q/BCP
MTLPALAPDFSLPDQDGVSRSLKDYKGRWLVLYFYPKDDTAGCTEEACEFRDEHAIIAQFGNAEVIGINRNSVASHKQFADKNHLNFPLLSDPSHAVIEAYGAWKRFRIIGGNYKGIIRTTLIIDPTGQIVKQYPKVNPKNHAQQIIQDLQKLQAA